MTDTVKKHSKLKDCPFCGEVPPKDSYYVNQGTKWGGVQCCIDGPEVRTGYQNWPAWKQDAIEAWNTRPTNNLRQYREALEALHEKCREEIADYEYTGEYELVTTAFKGAK